MAAEAAYGVRLVGCAVVKGKFKVVLGVVCPFVWCNVVRGESCSREFRAQSEAGEGNTRALLRTAFYLERMKMTADTLIILTIICTSSSLQRSCGGILYTCLDAVHH